MESSPSSPSSKPPADLPTPVPDAPPADLDTSAVAPDPLPSPTVAAPSRRGRAWLPLTLVAIGVLLLGIAAFGAYRNHNKPRPAAATTNQSASHATTAPQASIETVSSSSLVLDTTKQYGDKYADGLLPVGDNKYATDAPQKGSIYVCHVPQAVGEGAGNRGPWFTANNTKYDINKKAAVAGTVSWDSTYTMKVTGTTRAISTNDLPLGHTTGVFPIQASDPAYRYDRNPNSIGAQSLLYNLTAYPKVQTPGCMGGEAGVMTTGVALFDGFDAGGRDAGAWEVQDGCGGHPQRTHEYHYHTLSKCITGATVDTVIGYALDGFPITGPKISDGNILTTDDLDECHGITSTITLDGKKVVSYHYVMTQDFPYSISCFKATAIQPPGSDH